MIDVGKIEKLMVLMAQYGFDVVQAEHGTEKISLAKNANAHGYFQGPIMRESLREASVALQASSVPSTGSTAASLSSQASFNTPSASSPATKVEGASAQPSARVVPDGVTITSPFVGTFYRAPAPDASTFVELGSRVKKGQTLCIVEAMKLMNEIESEVDGEVVAILLENGKPVEFGTPLFVIKP